MLILKGILNSTQDSHKVLRHTISREIKYRTYLKESTRITIKVKLENIQTNKQTKLESILWFSLLSLPTYAACMLWGLTMTSLKLTLQETLNSHDLLANSVLLTHRAKHTLRQWELHWHIQSHYWAQYFQTQEEEECEGQMSCYSAQSCLSFAVTHLPLDYLKWSQTAFIFSENF